MKRMANSRLKLVTPATVKRTVTPKRLPNDKLRTREYLTEAEVENLTAKARGNRHGHRDATMIFVAYRHGLRASELVDLRWDQVEFSKGTLHVRRVEQGTPKHMPYSATSYVPCDAFNVSRRHIAVRVHFRTGSALHHGRLCSHGRAGGGRGQPRVQGAPAHASARLRLCACQ